MSEPTELLQAMLANPALPLPHRISMMRDLLSSDTPESQEVAKALLEACEKASVDLVHQEKSKRLDQWLKEIQEGPMRGATFIQLLPQNGSFVAHALVLLDDGTEAYAILPELEGLGDLRVGDRVVLDAKGRVLLQRVEMLRIGEVAAFERRIDGRHLEISLRGGSERMVFLASHDLMEQVKAGRVEPGSMLIVNSRRALAIAAVPPQDGLSHYRFLDRSPAPDIHVERDIGAPPRCIAEIATHVRMELTCAEIRRRYHLRRCHMKLLCGVSGTGKSLAVAAIHRQTYEIVSEVTGVPLEKLPPRVFRIRQGQVLSMWLGESEKNWERALNEVEQLADEIFTTPDGREFKLPVILVLEEVDGMGRTRGQEAVNDRILTTVLQRLDPNRLEIANRLIIVLATTNEPHLVDPALLRRLGGSIEHFTRLKKKAFMAVLDKLTRRLPAASHNGYTQREIWERHIQNLAAWFFSPNSSDPGLIELTYAGSTTPVVKYRRDFLTAALADRAVQQAAEEASQAELECRGAPGVTFEQLTRAFEAQLRGLADQLKEQNVDSYTDLPDGVRVATLRRVPQPAHLAFEFHRN